jgi:predicted ester cyclase
MEHRARRRNNAARPCDAGRGTAGPNICPDFQATVEDLIGADGDTVVTRLTYRGTDTGGFVKGRAATGKPFEFGAIYIWRLANGKVVELWQEADRMRLMQQLGFAG